MIDTLLIRLLAGAVETNDRNEACAAARLIAQYRAPADLLDVEIVREEAETWLDHKGRLSGRSFSIRSLVYRKEEICRWQRTSRAGLGLDRNHPSRFAAVASDDSRSRYRVTIEPVLEILGLEDLAPAIPETSETADGNELPGLPAPDRTDTGQLSLSLDH